MGIRLPSVFRGVYLDRTPVRFKYMSRDGNEVYVSGMPRSYVANKERTECIGIRVEVDASSRLDERTRELAERNNGILGCAADRIVSDEDTGLIVPVSKKEMASGTGAARFIRPRPQHVDYALRLLPQLPADTVLERHTERQFQCMTRHDLNEWIDAAKAEIEDARQAVFEAQFRDN